MRTRLATARLISPRAKTKPADLDERRFRIHSMNRRQFVVGAAALVGALARHITIDRAGRTLWIALGSKAEEVAVVDVRQPAQPRLTRRFRPPFLGHDLGLAPDGRHAWVSSGDRWELAVYDVRTGRL